MVFDGTVKCINSLIGENRLDSLQSTGIFKAIVTGSHFNLARTDNR